LIQDRGVEKSAPLFSYIFIAIKGANMNYYVFKMPNGKEMKLRFNAQAQEMFLKETDLGIVDGYKALYNHPASYMVNLIWASAQKFEHGFSKAKAYDLFDELTDEYSYKTEEWFMLATEILAVAGFFDQEAVASMKESTAK
jgi:hypothetical protein